jgi:hypothetical protein
VESIGARLWDRVLCLMALVENPKARRDAWTAHIHLHRDHSLTDMSEQARRSLYDERHALPCPQNDLVPKLGRPRTRWAVDARDEIGVTSEDVREVGVGLRICYWQPDARMTDDEVRVTLKADGPMMNDGSLIWETGSLGPTACHLFGGP